MKCGQVLEQRAAVPKAEKQRGGTERAGAQAAEQTPGPHFRTCGSTAISGPPSLCEFLRAGGGQRPSCPSLWKGGRKQPAGGAASQASTLLIPLPCFPSSIWSPIRFVPMKEVRLTPSCTWRNWGRKAGLVQGGSDLQLPTRQGREKTGPASGHERRWGTQAHFSPRGGTRREALTELLRSRSLPDLFSPH